MTTAEPAAAQPASTRSLEDLAQEAAGHARLRDWVLKECPVGDKVREEFVLSCLSAILHRTVNFGIEDGLDVYSCRELLQFQVMASAGLAAMLAKVTATRAIIEDDHKVLAALADSGLCPGVLAWFHELDTAPPAKATELLAACDPTEELHSGRLVVARRHPALVEPAWLWEIPERLPRLGAGMALALILGRPDLLASVTIWLTRNPAALYSVEPDTLLAPLVSRSSERPQTILLPLEGAYGDSTVASAAEWHLEHQEPREALELCARIRPLSLEADRARAIAALARLDLNEPAVARRIAQDILDPGWATAVAVRLAQQDPEHTSDEALMAVLRSMPADRAEAFFTALSLLVRRRAVAQAKVIAHERGREFAYHPSVVQLLKALGVV